MKTIRQKDGHHVNGKFKFTKYLLSTDTDDFNDNLFNLSHKIVPLCSPDWAPDWVSSWWSGWRMTDDGRLSPGSGLRGPILRPAAGYYELPPTQRPGIDSNQLLRYRGE